MFYVCVCLLKKCNKFSCTCDKIRKNERNSASVAPSLYTHRPTCMRSYVSVCMYGKICGHVVGGKNIFIKIFAGRTFFIIMYFTISFICRVQVTQTIKNDGMNERDLDGKIL